MASPALESVCCLFNDNATINNPKHHIFGGMSPTVYNALSIISASVSIVGAFYQLLPRRPVIAPRTTRELESWQRQNQIICWLAFADLLASIGVLVRASVWIAGFAPQRTQGESLGFPDYFCAVSTGWIQYFYICTYLWTFCYAVDVYRLVHDREPRMVLYHITGWLVSLVLSLSGLLSIYTPSLKDCRMTPGRWLPQFLTIYVPILMVMILNPVLCHLSTSKVESTLRGKGLYTDTERSVVRNLKMKFILVILVFYVCWFPNIINGILLLARHHVHKAIFFALWNYMALVNPTQAFLNSLVYQGLGGCQLCMQPIEDDLLIPRRRRRYRDKSRSDIQSQITVSTDVEQSSETSPLLSFRL